MAGAEIRVGLLMAYLSRRSGGVWSVVEAMAFALQTYAGCHVELFGLADAYSSQDTARFNAKDVHPELRYGPSWFGYSPMLNRRLTEASVDLVHAHGLWMYPSVANLRWAIRSKKPYLVSPHNLLSEWALRRSMRKKRLAAFLFENKNLKKAACLHALTQAEARAIRAFGLRNPICVVPSGVEVPAHTEHADRIWRDSLPDGAKVLFYLGRFHPTKGLLQLLRGWKIARNRFGAEWEWHLVLAGWDQGGHRMELKRLCKEEGVRGVRFAAPCFGARKDAAFRRADAFVLPSFGEGIPMTVLEAWSYRLPVVMTPECNLPEGFQAGAAVRVEPEPESIARGLTELIGMRDAGRRAMGERGRRLVEERFSWPKIAKQMKSVYEWVLGGGPKPECVIL